MLLAYLVAPHPVGAPPDSLASLRASRRQHKAAAKAARVSAALAKRRAAQAEHATAAVKVGLIG